MKEYRRTLGYSKAQVEEWLDIDETQNNANEQMQKASKFIADSIDGWTPVKRKEELREKEQYIKQQAIEAAGT